jgi:two-component system sensor histidine kinase CiaH
VQSTCDEAQGMRILTEDLLSMAKVEEAPPVLSEAQQVDFSQLTEKTVLQFEAVAFEQKVSFEEDIAVGVAVRGEEAQLDNLLRALVENACKYAGAGGNVSITLFAKQGSAILAVRNTGKVIAPADLPHVFERFYRSDKARLHGEGPDVEDGFGLGLAIAESIVEAHRGTIGVTSSEMEGTVFTVRLPLWVEKGGSRHRTPFELH